MNDRIILRLISDFIKLIIDVSFLMIRSTPMIKSLINFRLTIFLSLFELNPSSLFAHQVPQH